MSDQGAGVGIAWGSGYFAEVTGFSWGGISRPVLDLTTLATTGSVAKVPGDLPDLGQLSIDFHFAAGTALPIIANTNEAVTITFSDALASTFAMTGFLSDMTIDVGGANERVTGSATLELTGTLT